MSQEEIVREPIGRRGLCSAVHDGKLYLIGGYHFSIPSGIDMYDFDKCEWTVAATDKPRHSLLGTSGSCCVAIKNSLYVFGGWSSGIRNADIHELNLKSYAWRHLEATNPEMGPLWKDKAGMVDYGEEMLCVMGGYGVPGEVGSYQKGASYFWDPSFVNCWTNELHLFHVNLGQWISPEMTGQRPPPCAAFSFTRVDRHRVVLFGGRQKEERVDQLHLLDMQTWHWSGAIVPAGAWPQKRSFHSACSLLDPNFLSTSHHHPHSARKPHPWLPCLTPGLPVAQDEVLGLDPKLLVLWGMDNDAEPVNDAWILNVSTLTWEKIPIPESAGPPRIWFTVGVYHPSPYQADLLVSGGSSQNLFTNPEHHIENVLHRTSMVHLGMAGSLYDVCLTYLAEHVQEFAPHMLQLLPASLQAAVQRRLQQLCNQDKLFTYKCSL